MRMTGGAVVKRVHSRARPAGARHAADPGSAGGKKRKTRYLFAKLPQELAGGPEGLRVEAGKRAGA